MSNNIGRIGSDCVGCGNCHHVCKHKAIEMQCNDEGFKYPIINDFCIDCGLCLKRCPQTKIIEKNAIAGKSFIAISKDQAILKNAASGGIFGTIAKHFLSQSNSFVCGAAFDGLRVRHILIKKASDLPLLQKSKYVQSEIGDVFCQIKEILADGNNRVLFSGTPCQVAALHAYLNQPADNLFCIDIVCHGVPSPMFLEKDLKQYGESLQDISFRWRNLNKEAKRSYFFLSFKKGKDKRVYSSNFDAYYSLFMNCATFRYSCYSCKYANLNRVGDITIGDCDTASYYKDFHPGTSRSLVIISNTQGEDLWTKCQELFDYQNLDIEREAKVNHQLSHPSVQPSIREGIYTMIAKEGLKAINSRYVKPSSKMQSVMFMLQRFVPSLYKFIIQRQLH